uniref:Uncharacterized protein n=1 Tax=Davidia involucrata TaxID=16924 RepID=A0A5B7AJ19_DAVIN
MKPEKIKESVDDDGPREVGDKLVKSTVAPLELVGAIDKLVQVLERYYVSQKLPQEPNQQVVSDCVIEIDKLDEVLPQQGGHSIFEVPKSLHKLEPDAFIPHVVSIGPYHRDDERLHGMEKHKKRLLRHVLDRTGCPLEFLMEAMFKLEVETRKCYDKPFKNLSSQEFVEMMLLDACFILELLDVDAYGIKHCGYYADDPIFTTRGISPFIQRDLLMLENQLPFFVLDELFCLIKDQSMKDKLTLKFFKSVLPGPSQNLQKTKRKSRLHLLDVVRQALRPSPKLTSSEVYWEDEQPFQPTMHSVTRLRGTGVEFMKKNSTITDIEFDGAVLYIPRLVIRDSTKSIFLNLMVFEQYYPRSSNYVTSKFHGRANQLCQRCGVFVRKRDYRAWFGKQ